MEQIRLLLKITLFWWGFQRLVGAASESEKRGLGTSSRVRMGHVPSHGTRVIYLSLPGTTVPGGTVENRISYPATKDRVPHPSRSLRRVGCHCSSPEALPPQLLLIPPFAESAKDGAPDPLWQGKKYSPIPFDLSLVFITLGEPQAHRALPVRVLPQPVQPMPIRDENGAATHSHSRCHRVILDTAKCSGGTCGFFSRRLRRG